MKKYLVIILLVVATMLSVVGCASEKPSDNGKSDTTVTTEPTNEPSEEKEQANEPETTDTSAPTTEATDTESSEAESEEVAADGWPAPSTYVASTEEGYEGLYTISIYYADGVDVTPLVDWDMLKINAAYGTKIVRMQIFMDGLDAYVESQDDIAAVQAALDAVSDITNLEVFARR